MPLAASFPVASRAASWVRLRRCSPKVACTDRVSARTKSSTASREAPMMSSRVAGWKERTNSLAAAIRSAAECAFRTRNMPNANYASSRECVKREGNQRGPAMWRISIAGGVRQMLADARANKVKSKISILARSAEPLHDFVAGADASLERVAQRKPRSVSTEIGWGRGTAPFPRPKVLTHLTRPDFFVQLPAGRQGETSRLTPTIYF